MDPIFNIVLTNLSIHNPFNLGTSNLPGSLTTKTGYNTTRDLDVKISPDSRRGNHDQHHAKATFTSLPVIPPKFPSSHLQSLSVCSFHFALRFLHLDFLVVPCSIASDNAHQPIIYISYPTFPLFLRIAISLGCSCLGCPKKKRGIVPRHEQ